MSCWHDPRRRLIVDGWGKPIRRIEVDELGEITGFRRFPSMLFAVMLDETVRRVSCDCGGERVMLRDRRYPCGERKAPHSCRPERHR